MKKALSILLALVLVIGLVAGCGTTPDAGGTTPDSTPTPASTTENDTTDTEPSEPVELGGTFKLGGTGPLSGGAAIYGNAVKNGAAIAVEEINALGGIQFELRYEDDEHDREKAVNAYNALKDWGIQISLGSVTSTPGVVTSAESYSDRLFALTPSASAVAVVEGNDNTYQMCFTDPNQGSASAQYIHDNALGTKVAVIYKNDDVYSMGIYDTFVAKAAELGLEIVSATTFTSDSENDFSVQITDAQSKGADLVFLPIYYTPASLIFQQAASVGYAPTYFGVDGMDGILTLEGFDSALAEGVMLLTPFNADATDAATVSFVEKYRAAHGETPNQFAADGYDCVYAIYEAIIAANGTITADMDSAAICEQMIAIFNGSFEFDGLTGDAMSWDASGEVTKTPKGMIIRDGAYVGMD